MLDVNSVQKTLTVSPLSGATAYTETIDLSNKRDVALHGVFSGTTLTGTATIQVSPDGITFLDLSTPAAYSISGSGGNTGVAWVLQRVCWLYMRVKVVSSSGNITGTVYLNAKS